MKKRWGTVAVIVIVCGIIYGAWWILTHKITSRIDYREPNAVAELAKLGLSDDRLEDKKPAFDEALMDSRPLEGWLVNQSGAVLRLDSPSIKPNLDQGMLILRPSYVAVLREEKKFAILLPSANLLDGVAKQFDDGLYAALDLACYKGELGAVPGAVDLVSKVFDLSPQDSAARPFLATALQLAGKEVNLSPEAEQLRKRYRAEFEANTEQSKPISFYTWTPDLERVWKFYRFLQKEFDESIGLDIPKAFAATLGGNADLLKQYQALQAFYGRLTNPLICLSADALIDSTESLQELAAKHTVRHATVALFPPSTSRETELFERLFPEGVPADVNMMVD